MNSFHLAGRIAAATGLVATALLGVSAPAEAAARDGVCDDNEFCYYYNSDHAGSVSDFTDSVGDYGDRQPGCYEFKGPGAGKGRCIKNDAASVWNRSDDAVNVYFNSDFGGESQSIAAGAKINLNSTLYNENASHQFVGSGEYYVGDDYPYKGQSTGVDEWQFYIGECTSFSSWAINSRLGIDFDNYYLGEHWGNAENWDDAARNVDIPVSGTPTAGDIAVRNSGTWGHVAFVTSVNSDGTFEVDEYNYNGGSAYSHRTTSVGSGSSQFDAFIHFV